MTKANKIMEVQVDKRKQTRIPLEIKAELIMLDGSRHAGMTKNLSFGGAFVGFERQPEAYLDSTCTLILFLDEDASGNQIRYTCRIVHHNIGGIGLQFRSIDIDSYDHFKSLMINNSPEPELLMEELNKNPGLVRISDDDDN